jgi:hypothetical protein
MLGTALTHDDITSDATLTSKYFYAQSFRLGLPSVFRATYTFLVSHGSGFYSSVFRSSLRDLDVRNLNLRQRSTETVQLLISFPPLLFEDEDFVAFKVAFNLS